MKISIINPNVVTQKGDFFGTGIPYMPIIPAYLASYLLSKGLNVQVIDAFGENPFKKRIERKEYIIQGLDYYEIINKIERDSNLICIYAGHVVEHFVTINIIKKIKERINIPIVIIENSQAVTAYSLKITCQDFFDMGADFVIYGEPELAVESLLVELEKKEERNLENVSGLIYQKNGKNIINERNKEISNLDLLPFPGWDLFPIRNYWKLGYAHAPYNNSYLPILSSRGCPYNCNFCIIPQINKRRWRGRTPENIFFEMSYFNKKYGVNDFHFEDLNPIVDKKRIEQLCELIIKNKLKITFKFASGTKIDLFDEKTIILLKKGGCDYVSFSPESGSKEILQAMNKPFDYEHALKLLRVMNKLKITTQACFILGFPNETREDIKLTKRYILRLFKEGLDEVVIPIMTPIPGSKTYEKYNPKITDYSQMTFSPTWRKDYTFLNKTRFKIYFMCYLIKLIYHPLKFIKSFFNLTFGNFKSKSEMTVYRIIKVSFFREKNKNGELR